MYTYTCWHHNLSIFGHASPHCSKTIPTLNQHQTKQSLEEKTEWQIIYNNLHTHLHVHLLGSFALQSYSCVIRYVKFSHVYKSHAHYRESVRRILSKGKQNNPFVWESCHHNNTSQNTSSLNVLVLLQNILIVTRQSETVLSRQLYQYSAEGWLALAEFYG